MNNVNGSNFIFFFVSTTITILIFFFRLRFKRLQILWNIALILYIIFLIFAASLCTGGGLSIFGLILLPPGMLIYGMFPGAAKPCPSDFDVSAILTISFLFYTFVFWGILSVIKKSKENKAAEIKQDDNVEKQHVSDNDSKGI
jgi:membrane-bound ClpP family serine protease